MLPMDLHPQSFETLLDELSDEMYFEYMHDIARRAFLLLPEKAWSDISICAIVNWIRIDDVLLNLDHERYFRELATGIDDDDESAEYRLNSQTTSELRALILYCTRQWEHLPEEPILTFVLNTNSNRSDSDAVFHQHEIFAVLALMKILEAIFCFNVPLVAILRNEASPATVSDYLAEFEHMKEGERDARMYQENLRIAAKHAMLAMAALNYAEQKKFDHERRLLDVRKDELKAITLQENRHREGRQIVEETLAEWEARLQKGLQINADANGALLAEWLRREKNVDRSPRVVATWIRKHAKDKGIKFR